jgi:hypothetical protein
MYALAPKQNDQLERGEKRGGRKAAKQDKRAEGAEKAERGTGGLRLMSGCPEAPIGDGQGNTG